MVNINKYFMVLELLKYSNEKKKISGTIETNLEILRKYIKNDSCDDLLSAHNFIEGTSQPEWMYSGYLCLILSEIINQINFTSDSKEDLISARHMNYCIEAIKDITFFGLKPHLHPIIKSHKIFCDENCSGGDYDNEKLLFILKIFHQILEVKPFHSSGCLNVVVRDYMAAIFTLIASHLLGENLLSKSQQNDLKIQLASLWTNFSKCEYFRNILLLKGIAKTPPQLQRTLHLELIERLTSPEGFTHFVLALAPAKKTNERPQSEFFDVIANIVAHKAHDVGFHKNMIEQIFKFLKLSISNNLMSEFIGAGLLCLNRLWKLHEENRKIIAQQLDDILKRLTSPEDLIVGLIVMEHAELTFIVNFIFTSFCTSSIECLPSELLIIYTPLLLNLYFHIPENFSERAKIRSSFVRCLANRTPTCLNEIVRAFAYHSYPCEWKDLHPRIVIVPKKSVTELSVQIGYINDKEELRISNALSEILIKSEHNILIYNIFVILLKIMESTFNDDSDKETKTDLLQTEEELITFLNTKYPVKVEIILTLTALISHPPLKSQIAENSSEFLNIMKGILLTMSQKSCTGGDCSDHILVLLLTIIQEMIENTKYDEKYRDLSTILFNLKQKTDNEIVLHHIERLTEIVVRGPELGNKFDDNQYNMARNLMEESENHLKVYGINLMIGLLKSRNINALANCHITIALALSALKESESYIFLNCVRLFVALTNALESEVLETLSDEYLNKDVSLDYRLVVGEAILRVTKELGPLSYKYKDVLINCFLHGCRSVIDEFRWSSYSNLAVLCRTLSFQVQTFFYEIFSMIESEFKTGQYVPARRAAIFVLSELLCGLDNLMDFEDCLLPIYKLLKSIESHESCDEKIRMHATIGLRVLSEKCKLFLFPEKKIQKEITILGINDEKTKNKTKHILEIIEKR